MYDERVDIFALMGGVEQRLFSIYGDALERAKADLYEDARALEFIHKKHTDPQSPQGRSTFRRRFLCDVFDIVADPDPSLGKQEADFYLRNLRDYRKRLNTTEEKLADAVTLVREYVDKMKQGEYASTCR